jgi:5-methyltetrahydrofolate--homocysteine methyltransferase
MPDIQLRFHKDMLVLSSPLDYVLARQGTDVDADIEFLNVVETDTLADAMRMQVMAGASCLVTATDGICRSRLAHLRLDDRAADIARGAVAVANSCTPQHVLCEIGPSGLPLDPSSAASRKQSIKMYAEAATSFGDGDFDALFLDGMRTPADMACAIEGVRKRWQGPLFASVDLDEAGMWGKVPWSAAFESMQGADVVGFSSGAALDKLAELCRQAASAVDVPLLVQIEVKQPDDAAKRALKLGGDVPGNPYPTPDHLAKAAGVLRQAGAQFLRAAGEATPAYTGALAVAVNGLDTVR